jgi:hypothetical protein
MKKNLTMAEQQHVRHEVCARVSCMAREGYCTVVSRDVLLVAM